MVVLNCCKEGIVFVEKKKGFALLTSRFIVKYLMHAAYIKIDSEPIVRLET